MIRYNGIYVTPRLGNGAGEDVLFDLQVPAGTIAEIIRVWFDPADDAGDEILELTMYGNDAAATGGTDYVGQKLQGQTDAAAACTLKSGAPTIGATPTNLCYHQFHGKVGWLYVPQPDERPRIVGSLAIDNLGLRFTNTPAASPLNASFGVVWGEIN
jgi:hypothetical protein